MSFTFIDLFAGIGGFHGALTSLGGECVFASEIDPHAVRIYENNWGMKPQGDIIALTEHDVLVPDHDVLCAGFPCQPFSKSGKQLGMDETRGTLFWNILRILEAKRPKMFILENVKNLIGPRHRHEYEVIIASLRSLGYLVSDQPSVFSPHLLHPSEGGTPQTRDRVFITGVYVGDRINDLPVPSPTVAYEPSALWDHTPWSENELLSMFLENEDDVSSDYHLSPHEVRMIDAWDDFVITVVAHRGRQLDGFPIWADHFTDTPVIPEGTPKWKAGFIEKNSKLYCESRHAIDAWLIRHDNLSGFPPSRRKLEWQAQDAPSLWSTAMQLRPSGIRAKRMTYLPALVAINQTSIIGPRCRVITPREAARLQGFPEWFDFSGQRDALTYKQLGNAVNIPVIRHVFTEFVKQLPLVVGDTLDSLFKLNVLR